MFNYILQKRGIESKAKIQTDGFRSGRTRTFGKMSYFCAALNTTYDKSPIGSADARYRAHPQVARTICRTGHHRHDRIVALQHGRQHLHRPRGRAAGHFGTGTDFPVDEPRRGIRFLGGRRCRNAHLDASRPTGLRDGAASVGQRTGSELNHRRSVRSDRFVFPRPHPLLLRGERRDDRLCPRIHVHHPRGAMSSPTCTWD